MSDTYYMSRAILRRDAATSVLVGLMAGETRNPVWASHRLVWALFANNGHKRDFLYREEAGGVFYILSVRPPNDSHALFDLETKPFAPVLQAGDRLGFSLRVNPTIDRRQPSGRSLRSDVIMDAKHRAREAGTLDDVDMHDIIETAGRDWLMARASKAGVEPVEGSLKMDGYRQVRLPRGGEGRRADPMQFSTLDMSGVLEISEPDCFLERLRAGFGRARAFGCGLMLIRRG